METVRGTIRGTVSGTVKGFVKEDLRGSKWWTVNGETLTVPSRPPLRRATPIAFQAVPVSGPLNGPRRQGSKS